MAGALFEQGAVRYDAWYDTPTGAAIFATELEAVQPLVADLPRPWLEIGVGTGRFGAALGAEYGVDLAQAPARLARGRGVQVAVAAAEALPFPAATFGAVILVTTLCFVADRLAALGEARRVLGADGRLVLGMVPAEGPWGQHYRKLAVAGHPIYQHAHFVHRAELWNLLASAQFQPYRTRTGLFWLPEGQPGHPVDAVEGDDPRAGFLALSAIHRPASIAALAESESKRRRSVPRRSRPSANRFP